MNKFSCRVFLFIIVLLFCFSCRDVEEERKFIEPRSFDKQKWSDVTTIGVEGTWEARPGMARDLINRKVLIGESREKIIEMLGESFREVPPETNEIFYELEYIIKGIDPIAIEYLKIIFNQENKVERAEVYFYKTHDWRE